MREATESRSEPLALPLRPSITMGRWNGFVFRAIADDRNRNIAWVDARLPAGTLSAIVRAVNAYDAMREALGTAIDWAERVSVGDDATPRIKTAMALVAEKARAALATDQQP